MGSFLVWTSKIGVIQCAKMQFQAKICKFYVKIAAKMLKNFQNVCEARENLQFLCKILIQKWKKRGSLGLDWIKKGIIACKIVVKKGVYWQALDIHQYMGVSPQHNCGS